MKDSTQRSSPRPMSALDRLASLARGMIPAGQRLLTPDGFRPIEDVAAGDAALSYDPDAQLSVERQVRRIMTLAPEPIWEIALAPDGVRGRPKKVRATRHHAFLTPAGWRRVDRLRPGDFANCADADGERLRAEILGVWPTEASETVYAVSIVGAGPVIVERLIARGGVAAPAVARVADQLRGVDASIASGVKSNAVRGLV